MQLQCGIHSLDLSSPKIMAILNVTPDSFSDGGNYYHANNLSLDLVLKRAEIMLKEGADIIDVGGESTRPGAASVSLQQEVDRVVPIVEAISSKLGALVSVDTSTAAVIYESALCGAGMINDVRALQREGAMQAVADTGLPVCLMHMQGQPDNMQDAPSYNNIVAEVSDFLSSRMHECINAGIAVERILLDPGFGFGKTLEHNLTLLSHLQELTLLGRPILVGLSRKSLLKALLGRNVAERLPGSLAFALAAADRGANIVRVHDVAETYDVLRVLSAINNQNS